MSGWLARLMAASLSVALTEFNGVQQGLSWSVDAHQMVLGKWLAQVNSM
jgi:hypothetical protein